MFQHPSDKNEYGFIYPLQKINVEQSEKGNPNRLLYVLWKVQSSLFMTLLFIFSMTGELAELYDACYKYM